MVNSVKFRSQKMGQKIYGEDYIRYFRVQNGLHKEYNHYRFEQLLGSPKAFGQHPLNKISNFFSKFLALNKFESIFFQEFGADNKSNSEIRVP
jgi:hypothetical protein